MHDVKFAERLVKLRGEKSQKEVAEAIGITKSALLMYEKGNRTLRDSVKISLADYYGTTVSAIFCD